MSKLKSIALYTYNLISSIALTLLTFILVLIENYPVWLSVPIILLGAIADRILELTNKTKSNFTVNVQIDKLETNNAKEFLSDIADHIKTNKN